MTAAQSTDRLGGVGQLNRGARATRAKRSLAEFAKQAIAAGAVEGIRRVEWGPHLDAHCREVQLQLEAWLVANGPEADEPPKVHAEWRRTHADMIQRQREAWGRTGATWEDGAPEPWLRYVLVQNAVDNLPPTTLKSTVAMVCANAWIWLWCSTFAFGASSGTDANVKRDSLATRLLVQSAWYRETFEIAWVDIDVVPDLEETDEETGVTIRHDENSVSDWATTVGGRRISRTVGRGFTGVHVDGLYFDDPDDADRVHNESDRVRPQNRFTRAMYTRVNSEQKSLRRVLQQRLRSDDFTGYLLSIARWSPTHRTGWSQFCVPARFGRGPKDAPTETPYGTKDWRTHVDALIHPRITAGVLADMLIQIGTAALEAQYEQNTERIGTGWFARRHARWFVFKGTNVGTLRRRPEGALSREESPPIVIDLEDLDRLTLSVDAMNSLNPKPGGKTSAVGLGVIGCRDEERFLIDDRTRELGPSDTYWAIYDLMRAWPLGLVLIEEKALGAGAINEIERAIKRGWYVGRDEKPVELLGPDGKPVRCAVEPFNPGKDSKEQRAHAMIPTWEQGRILLLDGADWIYPKADEKRRTLDEGVFEEICGFPGARRSDRIDYLSQAFARHRAASDPRTRWRAAGRLAALAAGRLGMR